jgi:hypothetical protein
MMGGNIARCSKASWRARFVTVLYDTNDRSLLEEGKPTRQSKKEGAA